MKNIIVDRINELKHYTKDNIQNLAKGNIPYRANLELLEKYSYRLDGADYKPPLEYSKIFVSQVLPYTNSSSTEEIYTLPFKDAVEQQDIYPILLFINGKFIKWSDITLVKDFFYSYLIVQNMKGIGEVYTVETIVIPETNITYKENVITPESNCIFFFDSFTDLFVSSPSGKVYTTFALNNNQTVDIYKNRIYTNSKVHLPINYKIEKDSFFVFNDGLLYDVNKIEEYPLNLFEVSGDKSVYVNVLAFGYMNSNIPKDNESTIVNKPIAISKQILNQEQKFFEDISERFNFDFTEKDSESNMSQALRYIMDYNPTLMNQIYKDKSNIISKVFTGKELIGSMKTDGFVHFSRRIYDCFDCYFIVFKNGYLYENYKTSIYRNNEYMMRLDDVSPTDVFEILYITDVDNRTDNIVLWSGGDDILTIDPMVNVENMILASPTPHTHLYNHERGDNIVYTIDFEANRVDEDKVNIILKDSYYYDKRLLLGSKKQFRYHCMYNTSLNSATEILLPEEFKMCNDKRCYMIFINSVYIEPLSYSITTYNLEDPFYRIGVYFDREILPNDKIEVLYIGTILTKVYENTSKINNSGNILVDSGKLKYPFDYELYMIFIDGRKSIPSEITNIDSKRFNITTTSSQIINRVSLIQFVEEDEILYSFFKNNTDLLSSIIDKLSDEEIKALYSKGTGNLQTTYIESSTSLEDRMLRIVRDYWMKAYINNGDEMPIHFEGYYNDGQIIDTGNIS